MKSNEELLRSFLEIAVPMEIERLKREGGLSEERITQLQTYGEDLAAHGDDLLYRSKKKGESATRFRQFVEMVAAGAFAPGGITIFGLHFEVEHMDLERHKPVGPGGGRDEP
jgi:hypothetical protein